MKRFCIAAILLAAGPAHAEYKGNQFVGMCTTNLEFAQGYMAGYLDKAYSDIIAVNLRRRETSASTPAALDQESKQMSQIIDDIHDFCVPSSSTLGQATAIACKYVQDKPGERHLGLPELFSRALKAAWPCKN